MKIAIVVGEDSGDILGAGLMAALQKRFPECSFEGIGGERMLALGFTSLFPQDRLAVMGFVEPLKRLPELLGIRRSLREYFTNNRPDVFIGIDAPAFNTGLELSLRGEGIKTVHYVSPSVWAWRPNRIKKIAKAVDLMLTLFPFETSIYQEHKVPVKFVGHPLADDIPLECDKLAAQKALGFDDVGGNKNFIALMPGSRSSEVERLGELFFNVAKSCVAVKSNLHFLVPSANAKRHKQIQLLLTRFPELPVTLVEGRSHVVMAASDFVLMASGTTTLEAMLLKKPMIIAYKVSRLSYWIYTKLVTVKNVGLPNLLAGKTLVPEFIQDDATHDALVSEMLSFFGASDRAAVLEKAFLEIHKSIRCDASERAADAVQALITAPLKTECVK